MTADEAINFLDKIRAEGNFKIEISAHAKDKLWTIKAYHKDGYKKSCTTSAKSGSRYHNFMMGFGFTPAPTVKANGAESVRFILMAGKNENRQLCNMQKNP